MGVKFKRIFIIWMLALKNRFMERMVYRFNFFLMVAGVIMQMLLTLAFVRVIYSFINQLSGWGYNQALLVAASYMIVEGVMWASCAYLAAVVLQVRAGTLDILMVKPMDTQLLVTISMGDPEDWARVVTALAVFFYAVGGLNLSGPTLLVNSIFYLYLIICACVILYSITLIIRTLSFWLTESGSLWGMVDTITKTSQYPTDIFFHKFVRIFFSSALPIAFIATVPAKILIFGPNPVLLLSATGLSVFFFAVSRTVWLKGLNSYTSASS